MSTSQLQQEAGTTVRGPSGRSVCCIAVHLVHADPAWISLLESEGVAWTAGPLDGPCHDSPAVLIVPAGTPAKLVQDCRKLVCEGATALCEPGPWSPQHLGQLHTWKMPYDRDCLCGLDGVNDENAVELSRGTLGRGTVFRLPFRLGDLWADTRRARRFVAIGDGQVLYEDMAAIVKKNVRRVIVEVIKQAFFSQGLPYVHKWYYPGSYRSVLCFRGDADGGPRENFQQWLDAVRPFASCTSIFFCTSRYLRKRELIASAAAAGLEIGSHNHWHIVFPERRTNRKALIRAERLLSATCYPPRGFVAPAYFWHRTLYQLLEQRGYWYASCFGVNHDGIPYQPVVGGRIGTVLEIPFHCLGDRFPRFGISLDNPITQRFFQSLIAKKYAAGEPMHLYGHPDTAGRMGTAPQLVRSIIETALAHCDVKAWQLSPYAAWWRARSECRVRCCYDPASARLACGVVSGCEETTKELRVRVEFSDGGQYLVDPRTSLVLGQKREVLTPLAPLRLPAPDDVGEVIYTGPDVPRPRLDRRAARRFLRAYCRVYLPWLSFRGTSEDGQT